MASDLNEIDERLSNCSAEYDRYSRAVMDFANHGFASRWDQKGPFVQAYATMLKPIPTALRSHAGMIMNEARACLDGLACLLAARNGKANSRDTYFPVSRSEDIFRTDGMKKIKSLSSADQKVIIDLRPYRGGDNRLWFLHEADRVRKHTRLIMAAGTPGAFGIGNGMGSVHILNTAPTMFEALNVEHKLADIFMQGDISVSLIFGMRYAEAPIEGARVEFVMEDGIQAVRSVVDRFR